MAETISGGNNSYYVVDVLKPVRSGNPYTAECQDLIEALGMTFNEGCIFKAIWRSAAARTLNLTKPGTGEGQALYDAQKSVYYAQRVVAERVAAQPVKELFPNMVLVPIGPFWYIRNKEHNQFWNDDSGVWTLASDSKGGGTPYQDQELAMTVVKKIINGRMY